MLELSQRLGELGRQLVELVVRGIQVAQSRQAGERIDYTQTIERHVETVQLTQFEELRGQRLR